MDKYMLQLRICLSEIYLHIRIKAIDQAVGSMVIRL